MTSDDGSNGSSTDPTTNGSSSDDSSSDDSSSSDSSSDTTGNGSSSDDSSSDDSSSDGSSSDDSSSDGSSSDDSSSDDSSSDGSSSDDSSSDTTSSSDSLSSDSSSSDSTSAGASSSSSQASIGGWSDAPTGGWNAGQRTVGSVNRIPLQGLTGVNQTPSPNPATTESAVGRVILCVPASLQTGNGVEVLLHFHGHNVGYRQRVASNLPDAGTVRDVLLDQIEDQIGRSGRSMIAILPQGTVSSGFNGNSPFNCNAFITEVLNAAVTAGVWSSAPTVSRVVLSAHSGGGLPIAIMTSESGQPRLPTPLEALFLFEAINGTNELALHTTFLNAKLNADLQSVQAQSAASDQLTYLKTSFRYRGIYNTQDNDPTVNYAAYYASIKQTITSFFAKNAAALGGTGSDTYKAFAANYQVVNPSPYVTHDSLVGQGDLLQALAMLP